MYIYGERDTDAVEISNLRREGNGWRRRPWTRAAGENPQVRTEMSRGADGLAAWKLRLEETGGRRDGEDEESEATGGAAQRAMVALAIAMGSSARAGVGLNSVSVSQNPTACLSSSSSNAHI